MINTFRLAGYELRRFKGPLPILALLFLVLVPLLYGALYLWSNWDPYGKLDQVPVAVVNLDQPVTTEDGKTIDAGNRLVSELEADPIFDWQFVDADQAKTGLADGTYKLTVVIPPEFSANLASGSGDDPQRAIIYLQRDDANGYVTGLLTTSVQKQLESAINHAAIGAYFDTVFANLETVRSGITTAADDANQLATGTAASLKGATDLSTAVSAAADGATQLVSGLADDKAASAQLVTDATSTKTSSTELVTGLNTLDSGSQTVVTAADQVQSQSQDVASTLVPFLNTVVPVLPQVSPAGSQMTQAASDITTQVTELNTQLIAAGNALNAQNYGAVADALNSMNTTGAAMAQAAGQANQAAGTVTSIGNSIDSAGGEPSGASTQLTQLADQSQTLATGVGTLSSGISTAASQASTVDSSVGDLVTSATTLDTTIGTQQAGAQALSDGLTTASTGATALVDGLTTVNTGATQLATDLTDSANRVPALTQDQRDSAAQVLASPADVQLTVDNPAVYYGRGLAPFFFGIAIWVFGIAVFLVMRPISNRALAGRASSARITVAGWLPTVGMAALGSLIMLGVVWIGLGLDPVNAGGSVAVVLLAAAAFTAIAHLLRTWLGMIGTAIMLVLLMVQLTSAGGLYPVETLPAPFRAIHNYIPMTYLIDALRITISGGPTDHLWRDVGILAGFAVVAVAVCMFVVHRRRRFRMSTLYPALG
ncbi:MAG TPA: YhgE/Pip domain-containing protein [Nakamurella sp.]